MQQLQVLIDEKGAVIGTARTTPANGGHAAAGSAGPESATIVARPGQRVVQVNLDDGEADVDAATLHATIAEAHLS